MQTSQLQLLLLLYYTVWWPFFSRNVGLSFNYVLNIMMKNNENLCAWFTVVVVGGVTVWQPCNDVIVAGMFVACTSFVIISSCSSSSSWCSVQRLRVVKVVVVFCLQVSINQSLNSCKKMTETRQTDRHRLRYQICNLHAFNCSSKGSY